MNMLQLLEALHDGNQEQKTFLTEGHTERSKKLLQYKFAK